MSGRLAKHFAGFGRVRCEFRQGISIGLYMGMHFAHKRTMKRILLLLILAFQFSCGEKGAKLETIDGGFGIVLGSSLQDYEIIAGDGEIYGIIPPEPSDLFERYLVKVDPKTDKIRLISGMGFKGSNEAFESMWGKLMLKYGELELKTQGSHAMVTKMQGDRSVRLRHDGKMMAIEYILWK